MKLVCTICGAPLHHQRTDDGFVLNKIHEDGEFTEISSDSNGSDRVFCSKDEDHEIDSNVVEEVLDIVQN